MVTENVLKEGLKSAGIKKGMAIEVHSSLSSFGYLRGGAITLIRVLQELVTNEGTIVMPSFRLSTKYEITEDDIKLGITSKIKILEEGDVYTSTGMGIVSDTFRNLDDVITGNGTFRISSWGAEALQHAKGLDHLIEMDGWALLLGVDIYSLSAMHYVESELPNEIRDIFTATSEAREKYPEDQWFIECGEAPEKAWYKIQEEADSLGMIQHIEIGDCKGMLFKVRDITDLYKQAIRKHPLELYGLK